MCAFILLLAGYSVLDGFDLGVGMLHLFSKKDVERRLMLNSIGPVWDGNEVWLVTAGGALFAGFPDSLRFLCFSLLHSHHGSFGRINFSRRRN